MIDFSALPFPRSASCSKRGYLNCRTIQATRCFCRLQCSILLITPLCWLPQQAVVAVVPCFSLTWRVWLQLGFASALSDLLHQFLVVLQHSTQEKWRIDQNRHFPRGAIPLQNKHTKPLLVGEKPKAEAACYSIK